MAQVSGTKTIHPTDAIGLAGRELIEEKTIFLVRVAFCFSIHNRFSCMCKLLFESVSKIFRFQLRILCGLYCRNFQRLILFAWTDIN